MAYGAATLFVSPDKIVLDVYLARLREAIQEYATDEDPRSQDVAAFSKALDEFESSGLDYRLERFPALLEKHKSVFCGGFLFSMKPLFFAPALADIASQNHRVQALYQKWDLGSVLKEDGLPFRHW